MSAWSAEGLVVDRGGFRLGPVNLEVRPGESIAVLGRSGAGKTTLLRALAGLEPMVRGSLRRDGESMGRRAPERRGAVYVPPGLGLFPHRTARQNLRYPLELRGAGDDRRLDEVIERFGITPFAHRRPSTLSEGEKERVAAGRALLADPGLLLWDEPLTSIDPAARRDLLEVLTEVVRTDHVPTVVVTHDSETAFTLADRCLVLDGGSTVFAGQTDDLVRSPPDAFAARFSGFENVWTVAEAELAGRACPPLRPLVARAGAGGLCFPAPSAFPPPSPHADLPLATVRRLAPAPSGYTVDAVVGGIGIRLRWDRTHGPPRGGDPVAFGISLDEIRSLGRTGGGGS
ncbi:MAG: ATP-binding cassette domain-containing protein [Thermoplasmata archaeon]|nr:ATP-binding cassette domain-containing protein [Thermoplasmata archaeon]